MSATTARVSRERGDLAYWLAIAGVYFLVGVLFLYSGKGKLFDDDGHAPAALKKQFDGTFLATIPGVDTAWVIIGVMELAIFALMAVILLLVLQLPPNGPLGARRP